MFDRLELEFYLKSTEKVAIDLLGKILVKIEKGILLSGRIVETEAYIPENDFANHASVGKTHRNAPMFEHGGILYVYLIYGMYNCINVVTEKEGRGAAVLIRAIEPIEGIEIMKLNRKTNDIFNLCSGPGKIAQAFGFSKQDNYKSFCSDKLGIFDDGYEIDGNDIITTKRIGIKKSADLDLRFYLKNSRFISKK